MQQLRDLYKEFTAGLPLHYHFLTHEQQQLYESERRVGQLTRYFAAIALLISCLGLYGLAAFHTDRRLKEIGIRKLLGAPIGLLAGRLSADFTKLVLLAVMISLPLAYWGIHLWLAQFTYRLQLSIWLFAGTALAALCIALLTVSSHTIKAVRSNPIDCLRDE